MADEFEVGSIANIIGGSTKKQKHLKKLTTEIVEVKNLQSKSALNKRKSNGFTEKIDKASLLKKTKLPDLQEESANVDDKSDSETEESSESPKKKAKTEQNKRNGTRKSLAKIQTKNAEPNKETTEKAKLARTLFVGNLPVNFGTKKLKQMFQTYGKVSSVRVRSVAPAKITLSKKAALLSNQVNPNKKTVNAYIVFADAKSVEKAKELNGTTINDHTIQVDAASEPGYDSTMAIFLGNLSFKVNEDEVRQFFSDCGEIKNVRLIRDSKTGIGKGFGYVNFASKDSVILAIEKNGQQLKGREVRIKKYSYNLGSGATRQGKQSPKMVGGDQKKQNFQKATKLAVSKMTKGKQITKGVKKSPQIDFKGEQSVKKAKVMKKTIKNKIKSSMVKKQKKKLAEILSN